MAPLVVHKSSPTDMHLSRSSCAERTDVYSESGRVWRLDERWAGVIVLAFSTTKFA